MPAPIVLFTYNRLDHTTQTVEALQQNTLASESDLIIYSDGGKDQESWKDVKKVRSYLKTISGFKSIEIFESPENKGLANSVISGITNVFKRCNKVIVLEDDILTSKYFLQYMNNALSFYEKQENIMSVSGYAFNFNIPADYKHDVYTLYRISSWGWGTWKSAWEKADWNVSDYRTFKKSRNMNKQFAKAGTDYKQMLSDQMNNKSDSWAIRWGYAHFINSSYCLYPKHTFVQNIGLDGSGTHSVDGKNFSKSDNLNESGNIEFVRNITINESIFESFSSKFILPTWQELYNKAAVFFKQKLR